MRLAVGISALLVLAMAGWLVMAHPWSSPDPLEVGGDEFASDRSGVQPAPFNAKRAMGYLEEICKIGPRISGTEGMKKQQELLKKHFEKQGASVELERFTARQHSQRNETEMANLIVSWHPQRTRRIILCSHYDTRPIADQEENVRRWREPFVSANDGGSGVALLMELAHHVKDLKTEVGIDFVFFDGEEYVFTRDDKYFFGSEHFAREYRKNKDKTRYLGAVLLDMVGGKNARFPVEQHSWWKAPNLVKEIYGIAEEQKCSAFLSKELSESPILDDHLALNAVGIPAIDLIDFSYRHWHRLSDVPENCSAESLEQVARVLSLWVQRVK
jgi:hypothetical protein